MPLFELDIIETRDYLVQCTVKAKSLDEAIEKAGRGDTESEHEIKLESVTDREPLLDTVKKIKKKRNSYVQ